MSTYLLPLQTDQKQLISLIWREPLSAKHTTPVVVSDTGVSYRGEFRVLTRDTRPRQTMSFSAV